MLHRAEEKIRIKLGYGTELPNAGRTLGRCSSEDPSRRVCILFVFCFCFVEEVGTLSPSSPSSFHHKMSDKNASTSVGRDELAALLGASRPSDLVVVAANNDAKKSAPTDIAPKSRLHNRKDDAEDISKMDRAQAAALVAKKFGSGTQPNSAAAGVARHRVSGKRKRQYQLLANDLTEHSSASSAINTMKEGNDVVDNYIDDEGTRDEDDSKFQIARNSGVGGGKRKKLLIKQGGDDKANNRHRRNYSDSSSASSSSSTSLSRSSSSSDDESRPKRSRRNRRDRSNSSSSSSDEDEADLRRKRARAKAQRIQNEAVVVSVRGTNEDSAVKCKLHDKSDSLTNRGGSGNSSKVLRREMMDEVRVIDNKEFKEGGSLSKTKKHTASSSESDSSSSDDDSSTSSSSDSSEEGINPMPISKPLFVPKSKRGTVAEVEAQLKKHEEAEERRMREKERRVVQSRALVAEAVSVAVASSQGMDDGDEFDTGEVGGDFILVPDDSDPVDQDSGLVLAERDAWEVREIIRILRDVDEGLELEKERKEKERRRALTDQERLEEDRRSGRYRAPGKARRARREGETHGGSNYLQRYHHRGAFYLDDDTLKQAGENDIRHRALEYSRSVTGDRIDKRSLPEVMQVKNFGLAGYSTKYKGLAKEDTTDKSLDFLPISGNKGER